MIDKKPPPEAHLVSIVDDDASVRRSACRLVKMLGFRAAAFGSAEEFLSSGNAATTACLLLDVRMPGMNGLELQRCLVDSGSEIPIVFITARASEEQESQARRAGAVEILRKPVGREELLRVLRTVLKGSV